MRLFNFLFISLPVLLFFNFFSFFPAHELPYEEQLVNQLLATAGKKLAEKYHLRICGTGAGMPGGNIHTFILAFQKLSPTSIDEARKLIIQISEDFLVDINEQTELKPYYTVYPFTNKNIEITIYMYDEFGYELFAPAISIAGLFQGAIDYSVVDSDNPLKLLPVYKESYEEAFRIVEKGKGD